MNLALFVVSATSPGRAWHLLLERGNAWFNEAERDWVRFLCGMSVLLKYGPLGDVSPIASGSGNEKLPNF